MRSPSAVHRWGAWALLPLIVPLAAGMGHVSSGASDPSLPLASWDAEAPPLEAASGLVFAWVAPRTDDAGSEAFALANAGPDAVALSAVTVSDGEGTVSFAGWSDVLGPGGMFVVASDARHLASVSGLTADARWGDAVGGDVGEAAASGDLRLSNSGETLWVAVAGVVSDVVVWGRDVTPDAGIGAEWTGESIGWSVAENEVLRRREADHVLLDSDTAWDWRTPRRHHLGQTELAPFAFSASNLTPLLFPEDGATRIAAALANASGSAFLSYYQLTHPGILETLVQRSAAGVDVEVHLEALPAGESREERADRESWQAYLREAGVNVTADDERYRYRHGKVGGVDGKAFWVASENLRSQGQRTRGWGVFAANGTAHDWLQAVARDGATRQTAFPHSSGGPHTLLAAPDHTVPGAGPTPILDLIERAERSIDVQALNLPMTWGRLPWREEAANPYLEALVEATKRNVTVRLLLSGSFSEPGEGNRETASVVEGLRRSGLPIGARLHEPGDGGWSLLHNKGILVDGRWSVVGSLNLNLHSAASNREVAAILDDSVVAAAFGAAFEADWETATGRPEAKTDRPASWLSDPTNLTLAGAASIVFCTLVLLALIRRPRRG